MTYEACLAGIHSRNRFSGGGPTLDRIARLMKALGDPQESLRCIHVAGTNGKGSLCAFVENSLRRAGYKTGLFTSPYLVDFRERIQMEGNLISKELLISCYQRVMEQEMHLEQAGFEPVNEFELVTAIAFLAFSEASLDYVVLEVGLGGRSDPTNLISHPEVACIMPVSLDHTTVLGNTVAEIAAEKAGIIKPYCPVVFARQSKEGERVLMAQANEVFAPVFSTEVPEIIHADSSGTDFRYQGDLYHISLLGIHQAENAAAAIEVLKLLGLPVPKIQYGLSTTLWPGRLQLIPGEFDVLIDAGHNADGIRVLSEAIDSLFSGRRIVSIMAMMKDKDYLTVIPEIAKRSELLVATTVGLPRSLSPEELSGVALDYCSTKSAGSMGEALILAKEALLPGDLLLICGSVYAAGEAIKLCS